MICAMPSTPNTQMQLLQGIIYSLMFRRKEVELLGRLRTFVE
jgi:hypothetical protein